MCGVRRKRAACARTAAQAQDRAAHAEGRPPKALLPIESGRLTPVRPPWGPLRVTARRVRTSDAREVALHHRSDASPRTSPAMAAPRLREVPSGCRDVPRDASRCRASARGDATEMPAHAKSFHYLPRAARSRILALYGKAPRVSSVFFVEISIDTPFSSG